MIFLHESSFAEANTAAVTATPAARVTDISYIIALFCLQIFRDEYFRFILAASAASGSPRRHSLITVSEAFMPMLPAISLPDISFDYWWGFYRFIRFLLMPHHSYWFLLLVSSSLRFFISFDVEIYFAAFRWFSFYILLMQTLRFILIFSHCRFSPCCLFLIRRSYFPYWRWRGCTISSDVDMIWIIFSSSLRFHWLPSRSRSQQSMPQNTGYSHSAAVLASPPLPKNLFHSLLSLNIIHVLLFFDFANARLLDDFLFTSFSFREYNYHVRTTVLID